MTIKVQLTEQDLINAHMVIFFRKIRIRILFGIIGLFFILSLVLGLIFEPPLAVQSLVYLIPVVIIVAAQQLLARAKFRGDHRYQDPVDYDFSEEGLRISGYTFDMLLVWPSVKKIIKTKNWILIRQKWKITAAIPKAAFWEDELDELKHLLEKQRVKNNL